MSICRKSAQFKSQRRFESVPHIILFNKSYYYFSAAPLLFITVSVFIYAAVLVYYTSSTLLHTHSL